MDTLPSVSIQGRGLHRSSGNPVVLVEIRSMSGFGSCASRIDKEVLFALKMNVSAH